MGNGGERECGIIHKVTQTLYFDTYCSEEVVDIASVLCTSFHEECVGILSKRFASGSGHLQLAQNKGLIHR